MPKNKLSRIIVIVGPTASGKSDLAVRIAKRVNGEVISADSRQVYRGMNIGTGKINKKEMRGVPHHLLDVTSPKSEFNVSHFKKLATEKIEEIARPVRGRSPRGGRLPRSSPKGWYRGSRAFGRAASNGVKGHIPIIVGGTGFWIDALVYNWPIPEVRANRALRARLEKWPAARLFAKLQKLDPARAASIKTHNEINNKRRLIRAIEVASTGTKTPEIKFPFYHDRNKMGTFKLGNKKYRILILGIKLPQKELEKRIYKRLIRRLQPVRSRSAKGGATSTSGHSASNGPRDGMIQEIKKLHKSGVSWKRLDSFGLEYRYVSRYLRGFMDYNEMVKQLYRAIKNYAKRQIRWFKRNSQINWLEPDTNSRMSTNYTNKKLDNKARNLVQKFLYR